MKQNKNTKAFFELVKAGLWEADCKLANIENVNFSVVCRLAEEQSVAGLVTAGLEHVKGCKLPQDMVLSFVGTALQIEQKNNAMNDFLAELIEMMRATGIYALLVKGQAIAQCYDKPLWRACGDVDLFLSEDNYNKAKKLLMPLGELTEPEEKAKKHFAINIKGWAVELHGTLHSGLSRRIDREIDEIKRETFYEGKVRSWMNGKTQIFLLHVNNEVIYVFTHILQHFYKGGIGLRQICDWCRLLWTYREEIDTAMIEKRLKRMGIMSEWKAFGMFAVVYLGMPKEVMPFYNDNDTIKKKAERIKDFILMSGNFGHNRDMSYYDKYPYLVRKVISLGRRCGDLFRHARVFPMDSLKFFPYMMYCGVRSAVRGE